MVAQSAGGILGFARVSASEETVLAKIDAAFDRQGGLPAPSRSA